MSWLLRVLPVLVVLGAASACSDSGQHDSPTPMGRTFISTQVEGPPIPGGGPLTLTFTDGRVSASAGCNTSSGPVTFDGDVLRVSNLASTLMGCPEPQSGADAWQTDLLQSAPHWRLDGDTLTLTGNRLTVTLRDKKVVHPDRPLTGTTWTVTTLLRPDATVRSQVLDQVRPQLTIAPDGQLSGAAGCNRMTGRADIDGSKVTFHVATTRMACPPDVMEVEQQVLEALDGATETTIDADTLTIRNTGNHTGLVLQSQ